VRKFLFLANNAEYEHLEKLSQKGFDVTSVQFDEMLSFEHTRLKPLSIAIAVQRKEHRVIDIKVAESHYQGRLSAIALFKYGPRLDKSHEARKKVLETLQSQVQTTCHITTDAKPQYKTEVSEYVPSARLFQINNRGGRLRRLLQSRRRNIKDPMFELNLVAAKIRHNLSRMARKVWVTTKRADRLQKHLMLFIAYHNEYAIAG
jgi:IS1 family transposase